MLAIAGITELFSLDLGIGSMSVVLDRLFQFRVNLATKIVAIPAALVKRFGLRMSLTQLLVRK